MYNPLHCVSVITNQRGFRLVHCAKGRDCTTVGLIKSVYVTDIDDEGAGAGAGGVTTGGAKGLGGIIVGRQGMMPK